MVAREDVMDDQLILDLDLLKSLSDLFGPSGNEDDVRDFITSYIESLNYSYIVDKKGNISVFKDIENTDFRVIIASHIDEVGFLVSEKIEPYYVKVENIGGVDPQVFLGSKVLIKTSSGFVKGVFSTIPPHINKKIELKSSQDLFIDVGDNFSYVEVGNFVVPDVSFEIISPSLILGKALDNRIGTYINLHLMKYVKPTIDTYHVFFVQEELGLRGSKFFVKNNPSVDLVIVIEATSAETPYTNEHVSKLYSGPVITIMDKTYITNPKLVNLVKEVAVLNDIPVQFKKLNVGSTDAGHLQDLGNVIIISVPTKYIHSPYQISSIQDIQNTIKLISALISSENIEEVYKRLL